jgi:ketosteroid isomerase-like protein
MPDASSAIDPADIATPELMKAISAAFNSRDVDRIVSFFTDDATFWLARGPEPVGRTLAGKDLNYEGCDIYTFRGGKISAKNTFWKIVEHQDRL